MRCALLSLCGGVPVSWRARGLAGVLQVWNMRPELPLAIARAHWQGSRRGQRRACQFAECTQYFGRGRGALWPVESDSGEGGRAGEVGAREVCLSGCMWLYFCSHHVVSSIYTQNWPTSMFNISSSYSYQHSNVTDSIASTSTSKPIQTSPSTSYNVHHPISHHRTSYNLVLHLVVVILLLASVGVTLTLVVVRGVEYIILYYIYIYNICQ